MLGNVRVFGGADIALVQAAGAIVMIGRQQKKAQPYGWISLPDRIWHPSDFEDSDFMRRQAAQPSKKHPFAAIKAARNKQHVQLLVKTPAVWNGLVEQAGRAIRFIDRKDPMTRAAIRAFLEAAKRYKKAVERERAMQQRERSNAA